LHFLVIVLEIELKSFLFAQPSQQHLLEWLSPYTLERIVT